ncbi:hypothetical protein [Paracnuella aquatica]|uniref:hypothetical protein n=1 Tax=Paracnuella aquatica TaxID=2268757 RepID=UPI000F4E4027|nr:hypothetical protein [Paracnuella aquatica]RPD47419.1 hypothetical protein DRJ53_11235 [Paracnuella aquatica]
MRRFTICLALMFVTLSAVHAQEVISQKKAFYIHSWLGLASPGFDDLNATLNSANQVELPEVFFSRGGGFYLFYNNSRVVQFFQFATYSGSKESGIKRSWARGTQIGTSWGIDLRRRTRLQAIPYAGVAYSMLGLRFTNADASSGFTSYLAGSGNQFYVSQNQWLGNVGIHLGASPVGKSGFGQKLDLAVRAGYYIPLSHGKWKANHADLSGGPEVNSGGLYAGVVLGLRQ